MKVKVSIGQIGIGFFPALTLIFITLKLIGQIDWSWWWVLFFVWVIPGIIAVILLAVVFAVALEMGMAWMLDPNREKRRRWKKRKKDEKKKTV